MDDPAEVSRRKRRSSRAVVAGIALMGSSLVVSALEMIHPVVTTVGAVLGFVMLMYGVHLGWLVFYERDPDGPAS